MYNDRIVNLENEVKPTPDRLQQQLALTAGALAFGTLSPKTTHVLVSVDTANVRVTFDGSTPDANTGHLLTAPYIGMWSAARAKAAKFIKTGSNAVAVGTEFYLG
jgi:hypothetical protein